MRGWNGAPPKAPKKGGFLGEFWLGRHIRWSGCRPSLVASSGRLWAAGAVSFNGKRFITTSSGGMIVTDDEDLARYATFRAEHGFQCVEEPRGARANCWLSAIVLDGREQRTALFECANNAGVITRPIRALMVGLPMYAGYSQNWLDVSRWFELRVVSLPSPAL